MNGEEVGADNLIEKVLELQWNSGWIVAAPKAEYSYSLSPSPGHPVRAPAGRCRGCPSHWCHRPWHHHLLLHEETPKTVIPSPPGEEKEPLALPSQALR